MTPDVAGHVGYVLLIFGTWLVGKDEPLGWVARGLGTATWFGIGVWIDMPSIWIWSVVFLAVDLKGAWHAFRD